MKSDADSHTAAFGNITYDAGEADYTYYVTGKRRLCLRNALFEGEV